MKPNIITATYFLTRSCPLKCSYCSIVRPKKSYNIEAWQHELEFEDKLRVLSTLKELDTGFTILMGGEPLILGNDLIELIDHMNRIDLPYAIASASIEPLMSKYFERLVSVGVKNWSVSFDSMKDLVPDKDIGRKTSTGYQYLLKFKEAGVKDLHATITVTNKNLLELPDIVEHMTGQGIWTEITTLNWAKGFGYDFAMPKETMNDYTLKDENMLDFKIIMQKLKSLKEKGYLVHNDLNYFDDAPKYVNMDWDCENPFNSIVVDADGGIRVCRDIRGVDSIKFKIWDLLDESKIPSYLKAWHNDKNEMCKGCFWDCRYQSEYWAHKNSQDGKTVFQHKVVGPLVA